MDNLETYNLNDYENIFSNVGHLTTTNVQISSTLSADIVLSNFLHFTALNKLDKTFQYVKENLEKAVENLSCQSNIVFDSPSNFQVHKLQTRIVDQSNPPTRSNTRVDTTAHNSFTELLSSSFAVDQNPTSISGSIIGDFENSMIYFSGKNNELSNQLNLTQIINDARDLSTLITFNDVFSLLEKFTTILESLKLLSFSFTFKSKKFVGNMKIHNCSNVFPELPVDADKDPYQIQHYSAILASPFYTKTIIDKDESYGNKTIYSTAASIAPNIFYCPCINSTKYILLSIGRYFRKSIDVSIFTEYSI